MLFIGVTGEGVWMAVTCVRKQKDPSGDKGTEAKWKTHWKHVEKQMMVNCVVLNFNLSLSVLINWTKSALIKGMLSLDGFNSFG